MQNSQLKERELHKGTTFLYMPSFIQDYLRHHSRRGSKWRLKFWLLYMEAIQGRMWLLATDMDQGLAVEGKSKEEEREAPEKGKDE